MANKYIAVNKTDGSVEEVEFITSSGGAGDGLKGTATGSDGKFDVSLMPTGIGPEVKVLPATEDIAGSSTVNIYNSSGAKCRKADATAVSPKPAHGFLLTSVTSGNNATVYLGGNLTGLTGLTPGLPVFQSKTAGALTQDVSTFGTGDLFQDLGEAIDTDEVKFNYSKPIKLV
jgi:hypothetical protein